MQNAVISEDIGDTISLHSELWNYENGINNPEDSVHYFHLLDHLYNKGFF